MIKRKIISVLVLLFIFVLSACNLGEHAISVTFTNITATNSTNYTISIGYQSEDFYVNKGTDIYIKSDEDNTILTIQKELGNSSTIKLTEKNTFYSLTKLLSMANDEDLKYKKYDDLVSFNMFINSDKNCNLTLKAVVGNLSSNEMVLLDVFDVSKEFNIFVQKSEK